MNTQILNHIINTNRNNFPYNPNMMPLEAYNKELKTFSYNLGRRSGKTTSIIESAKYNPDINFLVIFYNGEQKTEFENKAVNIPNISTKFISPNNFDTLLGILPKYQVIILENYSYYQPKNSMGLLEDFLYKHLNSNENQSQVLVKLG